MSDDARRILAEHLWSSEPLTDWDRAEIVTSGLATDEELELLPGLDLTMDPRMYWRYVGTRWDVTLDPEGQPLLVLANEEGLNAKDPTAELHNRLAAHLRPPHEPLSEADVQAMAALGIASESDFEQRGGGCFWHHSIPEE